jgi:hypothetical protein
MSLRSQGNYKEKERVGQANQLRPQLHDFHYRSQSPLEVAQTDNDNL